MLVQIVAVKKLHSWLPLLQEDILNEFCQEIETLSKLRHPNVVLFMGASLEGDEKLIITGE